jgi:hypothetical protein
MRLLILTILSITVCSVQALFCQETEYLSKTVLFSSEKRQTSRELNHLSEQLFYIGDYKTGLQFHDIAVDIVNGSYNYRNSPNDSSKIKGYSTFPAKEYIIKKSKNEKIIIINESHHQPMHRTFTTSLLKDLYLNGFKYLAVETLTNDSLINYNLNHDKYPKTNSGYYSKEPQYGNLIRVALEIGFELIAYDDITNRREYMQALNIKKQTFDKDPNAKVLIHCGYGHGYEDMRDSLMGGWLAQLTGINPLTIDQVTLSEHSDRMYENEYYGTTYSNISAVFLEKTNVNASFKIPEGIIGYDMSIYHPRTKYVNGRPDWLNLTGEKKYYFPCENKEISILYPLLVRAYLHSENPKSAVPYDCIEITSEKDKTALLLKPGKYNLLLTHDRQEQSFLIEIK